MRTLETTLKLLKRYHLEADKSLGQNFLVADEALDAIEGRLRSSGAQAFLEIGPGIGTLTERLARLGSVRALELDERLIPLLSARFSGKDVTITQGDALKTDLSLELAKLASPAKAVVSNLPYYITSPLIEKYLAEASALAPGWFMVQKEVALRLTASPGSRAYGAMSVLVQLHAAAEIILDVPSSAFLPAPQVDSAFIRLTPKGDVVADADEIARFSSACFRLKRKTLANNLASFAGKRKDEITACLVDNGWSPSVRAEECSLDDFARLYRLFGGAR